MRFKKHYIVLFAFVLVFSMVLAACGAGDADVPEDADDNEAQEAEEEEEAAADEPQYGGELIIGQSGNPQNFNPLWSHDTASGDIEDLMFRGLYRIDETIEYQPDIAKDMPDISEDGLTWTVEMRDDVYWHDGEPVTADDVVFTMNIAKHEDYDGPRAGYFENLDEVEKVDDHTVVFHLKEPDATFLNTAGYNLVPEHILGDVPIGEMGDHEFSRNPVGNGPFVFEEFKDKEYVRLTAHEKHYEGRPYLDEITIKITGDTNAQVLQLEAGEIQMGNVPSEELETVETFDHVTVDQTLAYSYHYLGFQWENPLWQDRETRQAMVHALDRQAIIDAALAGHGEVAHIPASPLSWSYPDSEPPKYEYDPEKAKEMLAEAGWEEGADGILERDGQRFEFEMLYNEENQARADIAAIAQAQWKEVGIDVSIQSMEWGAFLDRTEAPNHDFDMIVLGWALGSDPSPKNVFHSSMHEGSNNTLYVNEELDELLIENERILDQDERKKMLEDIYFELAEDLPYIFLMYPMTNMVVPNELQGFVHHPRIPYNNAHEWWWAPEKDD